MDSVIFILCLNHSAITKVCIESVLKTTSHIDGVEVVVFNNGSTDNTSVMLNGFGGSINVFNSPKNIGVFKAMNYGHEYAKNKCFIKMANDHIVTNGWLECLLDAQAKKPGLYSPLTIDTPVIPEMKLGPERKKLNKRFFNGSVASEDLIEQYMKILYPNGLDKFAIEMKRLINHRNISLTSPWTGFQCLHPLVKEKVGYMDERFGMRFGADMDYIKRARKAGFSVKPINHYVHHWGSFTLRKRCSGWDDVDKQSYSIGLKQNKPNEKLLKNKYKMIKQGINEYKFNGKLYRSKF